MTVNVTAEISTPNVSAEAYRATIIPDGYIKPEGILEITENGKYDVTVKAGVNVNTPPMQWERPKDWLPYPTFSEEYDEIWMLIHISKDYGGARMYQAGKYTVDWGDGTVEEKDSTKNNAWKGEGLHFYDFESLDSLSETESGYRQCWCRAYRERGSLTEFFIGWEYLNLSNRTGIITCVEFIINTSSNSAVAKLYSGGVQMPFLRHIKVLDDGIVQHTQWYSIPSLEYVEGNMKPMYGVSRAYNAFKGLYNEIIYSFPENGVTNGEQFAYQAEAYQIEVDCKNVTTLSQAFRNTATRKIVLHNTESCTNFSYAFSNTEARELIGINLSSATDISYMYQSTRLPVCILDGIQGEKITNAGYAFSQVFFNKIPDLIIPNCTTVNRMFWSSGYIEEIGTLDFSSVTSANDAFYKTGVLRKVRFIEESIPISLNFSHCGELDIDSAKSIILGLKNYSGTDNEFTYTITLSNQTLSLLDEEGATAPDGSTWTQYAQSKGWNI